MPLLRTRTSRRHVLRGLCATVAAGAVTGFPTIIPATALGQNAPSNRINLAAIGVGGRGYGNCMKNFAPLPDVRFIAAVDCFKTRRDKFAAEYNQTFGPGICQPLTDHRQALALPDLDAVVISTPDHWHMHIALDAALAGKDMYLEKPLTLALDWAKRLRTIAAQRQLVFQYGTQQRSMKSSQLAVDLVRNGYVGPIERIDVWAPALSGPHWGDPTPAPVPDDLDYDRWLGPAPVKPYCPDRVTSQGAWHIHDYAIGFIAGWGAHPLDLLQWGMDADHTSPVSYEGTGSIAAGGLADTSFHWDIHCKYASGIPVRFMSHDIAKPVAQPYLPRMRADGTIFFGSEGFVSVARGACYMKRGNDFINTSQITFKPTDTRVYSGEDHARNFIDAVRSRTQPVNPLESAIRSDTISHLSDIAIRTGKKITWDPASENITSDPALNAHLTRPFRAGYELP